MVYRCGMFRELIADQPPSQRGWVESTDGPLEGLGWKGGRSKQQVVPERDKGSFCRAVDGVIRVAVEVGGQFA